MKLLLKAYSLNWNNFYFDTSTKYSRLSCLNLLYAYLHIHIMNKILRRIFQAVLKLVHTNWINIILNDTSQLLNGKKNTGILVLYVCV